MTREYAHVISSHQSEDMAQNEIPKSEILNEESLKSDRVTKQSLILWSF